MPRSTPHIAVLGAGLQGALLALKLANRGARVTLLDKAKAPLCGASRYNEGKVHLGYIFAKDAPDRTARMMIKGALSFLPELAAYVDPIELQQSLSDPFLYKVPDGSLLTPEALHLHYAAVDDMLADAAGSYLGQTRLDRVARLQDPPADGPVRAVFQTPERSIDPMFLCDSLKTALDEARNITLLCAHDVTRLEHASLHAPLIWVKADGEIEQRLGPFDHVVNCTWENRLALDRSLGITPRYRHLHRLKVASFFQRPDATPPLETVTLVLGPFGDVVQFRSGQVYFSWYPVACRDRSTDIVPPADWPVTLTPTEAATHTLRSLEALAPFVPGIETLKTPLDDLHHAPRHIFSWGHGDVDDVQTRLHERVEIGLTHPTDGYTTIDTGKLTTAPYFAKQAADHILGE